MNKKIRVLYIDDEDNNLNSFKASLRKDFHIITAIDAEDGLKVAEKEELHVVIADQRMPGLTGVEFFEKLMKINPDPIRILLTGYSDIASVIDAINKGEVYRFIDKPWNLEQIKNAIKNASDIYFTKKELQDKNERLKKVYSEMNQFVYSLSHELRGPLMSISGVSKLAKMETNDENILEYFEMIDSATLRLDDFIYKMLDFYRSTKIDTKASEVSFQEIIDEQLDSYREKLGFDEVNIEIKVDQQEKFFSDDSKLRVIINNLFSNAYKFQKLEGVQKSIKLEITVKDKSAIILIEDNGIGIDEKFHTEVFNLFHRATQRNVGSGLGLYMVKESVIQMGGEINLVSKLDHGTKFTIVLPSLKK
ncbi:hybrid sensor histidine kinase/response regulator [Belliella sp. R4-6]|uniref:histidine kinase n=1 Tax=Belliella alkalica TaxID=1730871 RepID=A0ABS9VDB9_9BACT|nr:hybrid sensor histidine kinase/response regulator [Belliella alkalica]MCH7414417.1 hybrid sensor histidine kinase/response regulator [Belliella alkalica]